MSDLINRQDAIRAVANYLWHYPNEQYKNLNVFEIAESLVKDALSVVPSENRPTGEWKLNINGHWQCSKCGAIGNIFDDFCRYCGAKMLDTNYQRAIEQVEHDMTYEPTYNFEDGSL